MCIVLKLLVMRSRLLVESIRVNCIDLSSTRFHLEEEEEEEEEEEMNLLVWLSCMP